MEIYSKSDIGLVRTTNEDCCNAECLSDGKAFAIVCDGMGGENSGDIASETAVKLITNGLEVFKTELWDDEKIKDLLFNLTYQANKAVFNMARSDPALAGMGTTIVFAIISNQKIQIVHAGDSRAYLINKESIKQLTKDHSIVQEMINVGEITPEEAVHHPRKNVITRALGIGKDLDLDFVETNFKEGDFLLICTDGLSNNLQPDEIVKIFSKEQKNIAATLVDTAISIDGRDNTTAVVIKF